MATTVTDRPPPSVWAVAFATALVAAVAGYFLGQASSIGVFAQTPTQARTSDRKPPVTSDDSRSEDDDEDDGNDDLTEQEIKSFAERNEECKLVLVVRTDLGMTKGVTR